MFRKPLLFCLSLLIITTTFCSKVLANEEGYYVGDVSKGSIEKIESFYSYYEANNYYLNNTDNYDNLVLFDGDTVLKMEYGVVEFVNNDKCSISIGYRSTLKDATNYINSCYGSDGAYLYSNYEGDTVYFRIAGDIGYTDFEDVVLHPYELLETRISSYENIDGVLTHKIMNQLYDDYYAYSLEIDNAKSYMTEGKDYYSYDGHYFYDDFKKMIDDYVNDTYENSINYEDVYYNYFEYLPFRSLTNYDYSEIEDYFYKTLKISDKIYCYNDLNNDGANDVVNRSQYYDELKAFVEYQNIYGVNALLNLGVSINESSYGKSLNSFVRNNLYNVTAYKNDSERNNNRYDEVSDSILAFAKYYVSKKYASYLAEIYNGLFVGDKVSGMNVNYSNDPYWGQKAASNYFIIDNKLGGKDLNSYCLGIIKDGELIKFYNDKDLEDLKFKVKNVKEYSLIILEELDDVYKVQVDPSFNENYEYDFDNCVAYIPKDDVSLLINEDKIHQNEMVNITFDAGEGTIEGLNTRTIGVLKNTTPVIIEPEREGYTIDRFDNELVRANEETTYTINYKKIGTTVILNKISNSIKQDSLLDLSGAVLIATYDNGREEQLKINTNMIEAFDTSIPEAGELVVNYNGIKTSQVVNVSSVQKSLDDEISELMDLNIDSYMTSGEYNSNEIKKIKRNLIYVDHDYSISEIRMMDEIMLNEYRDKANYRIDENKYDMSVSGLTLCLADTNITRWFKPFKDTYYVHIFNASSKAKDLIGEIGAAYGFEVVDSFKTTYAFNMKEVESNGPMVFSLKIDDKASDKIYTVYRYDSNGDVVKCRTTQSENKIDFLTEKSGDFVVLCKQGINNYDLPDYYENITKDNSDPDNHRLFIMGGILLAAIFLGLSIIVNYLTIENKRKALWNDYRKSLQKAESAQEEKPKN